MPKKITLLVPCFNEEENIEKLIECVDEEISKLSEYKFEIFFVDDGSTDDTKAIIKNMAEEKKHISYIFLSRNFGKENAMMAGIDYVNSDAVILMDADLQDPPNLIGLFIAEWENGFCNVCAKRSKRKGETILKKTTSWLYYQFLHKIADIPISRGVGDFRLIDRKCVDALKECKENQRYTKGLFEFVGFSKKEIEFVRERRFKGETKYSYSKLIKLALQGVVSFSTMPLKIAGRIGFLAVFISFIFAAIIIVKKVFWGDPIIGYPSLVTVIVFLSGLQFFTIGVLSEYVSVIFHETKGRPSYIVDEKEMQV